MTKWLPKIVQAASVALVLSSFINAVAAQTCEPLKPAKRTGFPDRLNSTTIAGALRAVEAPKRHIAIPAGSLDSVRISLDRTQCYGSCPDYAIELSGDGSASYTGRSFVAVLGKHTFKIADHDIRCLLSHFQQADFWSLKDEYVADATDSPSARITLTVAGQTKSVTDYLGSTVGMPALVSAIEDEIDRVARSDRLVKGTAETLPSLREEGFDFHSEAAATLLANAAGGAPLEFVNGLIELGVPVTGRSAVPVFFLKNQLGPTAIERALQSGRVAVAQALIDRGALSDASQSTRDDALRAAAASGNPLLVARVLTYRPNIDAQDAGGNTALFSTRQARANFAGAFNVDLAGVVRLLIAAGADPNAVNKQGQTALFHSADAAVVRLLLEAGAKIDVRDRIGRTPLLSAASDAAAVVLIRAGADTTVVDAYGTTVEKNFRDQHFDKAVQLLRGRKR